MAEPLWQATEKQTEFLSASEFEVLYGGAAGGGKSDGLLIDALGLQQRAIANPIYRGLIIRKSFPQLRELIDRSKTIYPEVMPGAFYHETSREWWFPSGAKIEFGHLASPADKIMYQGRQFQWVGWDELTHWATPEAYEYLLSRVRSPDPALRRYVRATTNPGGPGHKWVMERWQIPTSGEASRVDLNIEGTVITRRFIPARLTDNPYLANSGYRETLLTLREDERRALLDGRWDIASVKGAYYIKEIEQARKDGRICKVPVLPNVPVNTFWDIGWNDTFGSTGTLQILPSLRACSISLM